VDLEFGDAVWVKQSDGTEEIALSSGPWAHEGRPVTSPFNRSSS
jgi:hypothetical protein